MATHPSKTLEVNPQRSVNIALLSWASRSRLIHDIDFQPWARRSKQHIQVKH